MSLVELRKPADLAAGEQLAWRRPATDDPAGRFFSGAPSLGVLLATGSLPPRLCLSRPTLVSS